MATKKDSNGKRGRPSKYSKELADEIVERISEGETLSEICREKYMPNRSTVYDWMNENEEFSQRIARAREEGYEVLLDECKEIADAPNRVNTITGASDAVEIQHRKLQIETRLKLLAKWNPKKYGDKVDVTSNGEKVAPVVLQVSSEQEDKIKGLTS